MAVSAGNADWWAAPIKTEVNLVRWMRHLLAQGVR